MSGSFSRRLRFAVASVIALTLSLLTTLPAFANGLSLIFPDPVSPNGRNIYNLYLLITIPAVIIFLGVEIGLLYIIFRFRRRSPDHWGASWHGNTPLEIAWTVIPTLIIAAIAFVSYQELVTDFTPEAAKAGSQMNVAINGYQFYWTYTYDQGFTVNQGGGTNPMVVPVDTMVHLTFDSDNVIHSWWVPALSGKTDAVPGYTNQSWIKVDPSVLGNCSGNDRHVDQKTGGCEFHGECAELCGAGHATMQIDVLAVSKSQFLIWEGQQAAKAHASPSPSPSSSPSPSPSPSPKPSPSAGGSPSPSPSA